MWRADGSVLLVRLNYAGRWWTLPGGGVDRHESYEEAAYRELAEESGVKGVLLHKVWEYKHNRQYKRDTVQVFQGHLESQIPLIVDGIEIVEAGWFMPHAFPEHTSPRVNIILAEIGYIKNAERQKNSCNR